MLADLKEAFGLTLIIISHDLAVIRHMSDRVAVMYLGKIVEMAEAEALFERPLHPYTQALLAAIPVPVPGHAAGGTTLTGDIPSPIAPPPGCHFHTRCPHAIELCKQKEPALEIADGEERFVACHRWREIPAAGLTRAVEPALTDAAARRFALYRERSAGKAAAASTTEAAP